MVKNLGDGSLITFDSATSALGFALALQRSQSDDEVQLRVGLAAGEPLEEDGDIHGAIVALASRIVDQAEPGGIVVADSVRQLAIGKNYTFVALGETSLKGFDDPLLLWSVQP